MVTRDDLVAQARLKPIEPYTTDESLTFFSPQENVEGLDHPSVRAVNAWKRDAWTVPSGGPRLLLLMPCQKTKPYPLSREHLQINGALLGAGFVPAERGDWPDELLAHTDDERLLSNAPLLHPSGLVVDRAVVSEPFGLVPYEIVYRFGDGLSPVARYDDPGLFEHRGIGCPWRDDDTTVAVRPGFYRWGDNERAAYVEAHNRLAAGIRDDIARVAARYVAVLGYMAPGMTHRSFLCDARGRTDVGMPRHRRVGNERRRLTGVLDLSPGLLEVLPTPADLTRARAQRGGRLTSTPLQDPLLLQALVDRVSDRRRGRVPAAV